MYKLIAHRGNNNHSFKENTLNAIKNSLSKNYINGVEIDIRLTKDKKVVIYHNPTIFLNGKIRFINRLSLKDLSKEKIDTIDVLSSIKTSKLILIDIKYKGHLYKEVVDIIYQKISKYNLNIYLCSFNYKLIRYFKKKYSYYKCGYIISRLFNYHRIFNSLDFNVIKYNLYKRGKKEIFIWTINKLVKLNNFNRYIITDKAYIFNDILP